MSNYDSPLENIRIASPCSANWNEMQGNDRKRFCGDCKLSVYNLSGMTRYDAEHLLRLSEGRLCVRYFQRADGTILTRDCPVGWGRMKQRASILAATVFSLVVSLFAGVFIVSFFKKPPRREPIMGAIAMPTPIPTPRPAVLMGKIAMPTPTPKVRPKTDYIGKALPVYPGRSS